MVSRDTRHGLKVFVAPDPSGVFTLDELERLERVRELYQLARYWHLKPSEIRRLQFESWRLS